MLPIVWIHGFPLSSHVFDPQRPLGGTFPDLPGFGNAAPPTREMTMDDYARFVLDHAPKEPAIFAGLSMGGYVAFALARLAPERVGGLILIDTRETPDSDDARKGRFDTIANVEKSGVKAVADAMLPKMVKSEAYKERVYEIMMSSSKEGVIAALRAMATRPDSSALLPTLRVPTLIVVGEEDAITPPADAERMANAIPNAKLVRIANAAHLSNYEQADAFNAAVQNHLK
jgi:pimeloyl-ACP methyl ester carboxylesterase